MRVQLFNPPIHHYTGLHYRMNPPLGLPIIAAVLEQAGHDAEVWDLEALGVSPDKLARAFGKQKAAWPDAVGFTVTCQNARGARESIAALRSVGYDRPILVGGPQITLDPHGWDAIAIVGECEGSIVADMQWAVEAVKTEPRTTAILTGEPMDIDDIPPPLWSKHVPRPREYGGNAPILAKPEGITMWSRGCPHRCIFCSNPCFRRQRIRYRSPELIREEMQALVDMGIKAVFVYDDEAVQGHHAHQEWLIDVCEQIKPLGLLWKCQGRCSTKIERETLQAMYDAGCRGVMWGVESMSQKVLDAIRKDLTEEDIWHTLRLSHEVGINNWILLMVGNYQETPDDLAYTYRELSKAQSEGLIRWLNCTVCTPLPGTELYDWAKAEGWYVEPPEHGPPMGQAYAPTPWLSTWDLNYWRSRFLSLSGPWQ